MQVVVHYGEIALKGGNRPFFERTLIQNIEQRVGGKVDRAYGRFFLEIEGDVEEIKQKLLRVPGISNFSFAETCENDLEKIKQIALKLAKERVKPEMTFRVETKRSLKTFPKTSIDIDREIGATVHKETGMKGKMKNPDLTIFIEITEKGAYVFAEKIRGLGGLPVGVTGKMIALVSGGIDSPVAAFRMLRRGCKNVVVHFHNYTPGSAAVRDKIVRLSERIAVYQGKTKVYIIPFAAAQRELIKFIPAEVRMVAYRRLMLKMAERIFYKENAKGFVTGDNIAQVASQTPENIKTIYSATPQAVFAPLIGYDKQDIMEMAKQIGTYEISIEPYQDCCSYLVAEHPNTKTKVEEILELEKKLDVPKIVQEALEKVEIITVG